MTHPDTPAEQAHVDLAYQRLADMRAAAQAMLRDAFGERGGTFQAVTERDIRVRTSLNRLDHLQIGRGSLVFGRIDGRVGEGRGTESFHIGRLAISDSAQEPLVVDWRAPVAEPFYRATGAHPMGLTRRRHFLTDGQQVIDLEDELFGEQGSGVGLGLDGSQVLTAALERARTGRMQDIVGTIQREQDEIVRAPLPGVLVVQGGPGTGKTAVALHRAAYLLYTHRFPLEVQGVLVVGPNPTFLRYIEHVLPSLDETGVELSTVAGLYHGSRPIATEDPNVSRLKGDARMAAVVAKAVADRQRPLRHTITVPYGSSFVRITPALSQEAVTAVKRRRGPHNGRRRLLERTLWRLLVEQVERRHSPDAQGNPLTPDELGSAIHRTPEAVEALNRMWPLLTPEQLLHDLYGAPPLIELAGAGVLSPEESFLLRRDRVPAGDGVAWTDADIPLLDEADALLGPKRRQSPDDLQGPRKFGHVVIDEAQDLSPMELRMVGRRSLAGSMTVVGDIAQATGLWARANWSEMVEHLSAPRGWRLAELTVNYRTPAEIMDLAARVLHTVAPLVQPPRAVRATGRPPTIVGPESVGTLPPVEALAHAATSAVKQQMSETGENGSIGIVAPPSLIDPLANTLQAGGLAFGLAGQGALDEAVTLVTVDDVKGLEFDVVVVVEPNQLVDENPQGLNSLYVALTRATQTLVIVHHAPLPGILVGIPENTA